MCQQQSLPSLVGYIFETLETSIWAPFCIVFSIICFVIEWWTDFGQISRQNAFYVANCQSRNSAIEVLVIKVKFVQSDGQKVASGVKILKLQIIALISVVAPIDIAMWLWGTQAWTISHNMSQCQTGSWLLPWHQYVQLQVHWQLRLLPFHYLLVQEKNCTIAVAAIWCSLQHPQEFPH